MKYLSLFSGVEAATLAWEPLGWEPMAFCEIEPFPSAVLAERWPDIPNLGDVTAVDWEQWLADNSRPDVIVAGSPCQAFSVAGNRLSLEDARGNLSLFTAELVRLINPRVFLWENVPGALSTKDNAFGCFVGELVGAGEPLRPSGKRWTNAGLVSGPEARLAWRVFDAQYFGVPQRRRRLFAARCPRDGTDPAEVLLERESLFGDPAPRREERTRPAGSPARGSRGGGFIANTANTLAARGTTGGAWPGVEDAAGGQIVADAEAGHLIADDTTIMACAHYNAEIATDLCTTLSARQYKDPPIAFTCKDSGQDASEDQSPTLRSMNEIDGNANAGGQVAIGFYSTGGTHGVSAVDDGSPAVKVGSGLEIPSPPAVCCVFTSDGETADPIGANEQKTYTNEGGHNFRMHNVVGEPLALASRTRDGEKNLEWQEDIAYSLNNPGEGGRSDERMVLAPDDDPVAGFRPGQSATSRNVSYEEDMAPTLEGGGGGNNRPALQAGMAVRRLTPIECERLQGMPDNHTRVAWRGKEWEDCPDGPRYKAIGNSMAVPVINWLGRQIESALGEEG
jgi:DNA (cytosine-5)-methyltransferase 1